MNLVRKWFANNNLKQQGWVSNGKKEGTHYLYYQSGFLRSVTNYLNGKLHGVQKYYFFTGEVKQQVEYFHGTMNGQMDRRSIEGEIIFQCFFVDNKREGVCYEAVGADQTWSTYSKGLLNGSRLEIKASNKTCVVTEYRNNRRHGDSKVFTLEGALLQHSRYQEDRLEGDFIEYSKDLIQSKGTFKDGLKHGDFITYYSDGKIQTKAQYKNNKQIDWKAFDQNGRIIPEKKHAF